MVVRQILDLNVEVRALVGQQTGSQKRRFLCFLLGIGRDWPPGTPYLASDRFNQLQYNVLHSKFPVLFRFI
jgi:hypothetical protein